MLPEFSFPTVTYGISFSFADLNVWMPASLVESLRLCAISHKIVGQPILAAAGFQPALPAVHIRFSNPALANRRQGAIQPQSACHSITRIYFAFSRSACNGCPHS